MVRSKWSKEKKLTQPATARQTAWGDGLPEPTGATPSRSLARCDGRRWSQLSDAERKARSAAIAAAEAAQQGNEPLATPEQHVLLSAILSRSCAAATQDEGAA